MHRVAGIHTRPVHQHPTPPQPTTFRSRTYARMWFHAPTYARMRITQLTMRAGPHTTMPTDTQTLLSRTPHKTAPMPALTIGLHTAPATTYNHGDTLRQLSAAWRTRTSSAKLSGKQGAPPLLHYCHYTSGAPLPLHLLLGPPQRHSPQILEHGLHRRHLGAKVRAAYRACTCRSHEQGAARGGMTRGARTTLCTW